MPPCKADPVTSDTTEITYRLECRRAVSSGILETAGQTFLLLIAVSYFHAGPLAKALVAGGGSLGLLLSPVIVSLTSRLNWSAATSAVVLAFLGAGCFLGMIAAAELPVFVAGSILAMTASSAAIPLVTQIYQENYPARQRGRRFSRTVVIRIGVAAVFSEVAGHILHLDMENFRWLLCFFALAFLYAGHCFSRYPSRSIARLPGRHPFRAFQFLRDDRIFRRVILAWMLMGFANLVMFPMRVEYLANAAHGLALPVATIAGIVGVLPNVFRLLSTPLWGYWFDHTNFFLLRILINLLFGTGIGIFFSSTSLLGLAAGAILFGFATAGGEVAWNLWVTKLAPHERVADYMSVHTFFTGLRGLLAPLLGFSLLGWISVPLLAYGSVAAILLASAMLVPVFRQSRN